MQKWKEWPTVIITEEHRYKIGLDLICEFLHQRPDNEFEFMWKANRCVKDYTLEQFQRRIGRKLDQEMLNNRSKNKE